MGEVRPLQAGGDDDDVFEPEITWSSAEGTSYTMRLDFGIAREMSKSFKADILAKTFEWSDLKGERWPELAKILHPAQNLSVQDWERILHPRNATLMVRAWLQLWRKFNASSHDELERAEGALAALNDLDEAPEHIKQAAMTVARWCHARTHPEDAAEMALLEAEGGGNPLGEDDEGAPTG